MAELENDIFFFEYWVFQKKILLFPNENNVFLHYGWFLQNLGKDFNRTNTHTTAKGYNKMITFTGLRGCSKDFVQPKNVSRSHILGGPVVICYWIYFCLWCFLWKCGICGCTLPVFVTDIEKLLMQVISDKNLTVGWKKHSQIYRVTCHTRHVRPKLHANVELFRLQNFKLFNFWILVFTQGPCIMAKF